MRPREFIAGLGAAAWPTASLAQQATRRVRLVRILSGFADDSLLESTLLPTLSQLGSCLPSWPHLGGNHETPRIRHAASRSSQATWRASFWHATPAHSAILRIGQLVRAHNRDQLRG
jgi:hypothetical protein